MAGALEIWHGRDPTLRLAVTLREVAPLRQGKSIAGRSDFDIDRRIDRD